MDSTPVNWEALDALVLDFVRSDNLIEDLSSSSSPSSSSYHSRLLIRHVRRSLEAGNVDAAISLLQEHAPHLLQDHRLLFRLQKQKFIELLRRGTDGDRDSAIRCLRNALAPVALDAYPEAYEEFKHILLALIFNKEDQTSPVANEWSEKRRFEIAGLLSSVLRAQLHAYDPVFALTLRYLISIHKGFCFRQGIVSPISDLTQRLLFEERDPPATPQESSYEAPPFDEVDIQALAHAVELTRQGAIDSLKFAKGNLFEAFQNELCRMKMDASVLDELVHEYCVYRGIVGTIPMSLPGTAVKDCGTSRLSDGETSVSNVVGEGDQAADSVSKPTGDSELREAHETGSNHEDCSTSDAALSENYCRRFRRSRSHAVALCGRQKRWKGRDPEMLADTPLTQSSKVKPSVVKGEPEEQISSHSSVEHVDDHKYGVILELRELTCKGMTSEVVEEVNAMDPDFFVQNPSLLFKLKQVEFLKLVGAGAHNEAIKIACSHLGPLANSNPELLKPLKETLFVLLRSNEDALASSIPLSVLATSLQVAMGGKLGIEEPQLMKIMRATLHTHNEWFKLQMCKDRFEGFLNIDNLKEIDVPVLSDFTTKVYTDSSTHGPVQDSVSANMRLPGGASPASVSSGDVCDENAILKVMEFLAVPRADAIYLLSQYNGNAETVIQQLFA